MSQQCLIVAAIFGGESEMDNVDDEGNAEESSADQAMCVFSFFLFVVYAFFSLLLAVFRNDLIRDEARRLRGRRPTDDRPTVGGGER